MARKKKPSTTVSVSFKGVQSRQLLPEDDYRVKLVEATSGESKSSGDDQIEWVFEVSEGKLEGNKLWFYTPLGEKSLWKLHGLLTALGIEVPDDDLDIDLEQMVEDGLELMAVVQHETYDGTKRSKMMDFYPVDDDAKDEPKGKSKDKGGKGKKKDEPKKVAKSDVEDMDRDGLEELITDMDLEVDPDDYKKLPKLLAAILEELDEKELFEEDEPAPKKGRGKTKDEEDDDPAAKRRARRAARAGKDKEPDEPKGKAKGKAKKLEPMTTEEVQGLDEEELQEVIDKYELVVDLDDFKTLRKKAAAVIDGLEEKDMIDDD